MDVKDTTSSDATQNIPRLQDLLITAIQAAQLSQAPTNCGGNLLMGYVRLRTDLCARPKTNVPGFVLLSNSCWIFIVVQSQSPVLVSV